MRDAFQLQKIVTLGMCIVLLCSCVGPLRIGLTPNQEKIYTQEQQEVAKAANIVRAAETIFDITVQAIGALQEEGEISQEDVDELEPYGLAFEAARDSIDVLIDAGLQGAFNQAAMSAALTALLRASRDVIRKAKYGFEINIIASVVALWLTQGLPREEQLEMLALFFPEE